VVAVAVAVSSKPCPTCLVVAVALMSIHPTALTIRNALAALADNARAALADNVPARQEEAVG
jgi:hypothetical protein